MWKEKLFCIFLINTYVLRGDKFSLIKASEGTFLILGNLSNATNNILTVILHFSLRWFLAFVLGIVKQLSAENWGVSSGVRYTLCKDSRLISLPVVVETESNFKPYVLVDIRLLTSKFAYVNNYNFLLIFVSRKLLSKSVLNSSSKQTYSLFSHKNIK